MRKRKRTVIELHNPTMTFFITPDEGYGQWVTVSRFDGKLYVRGTYVDASPHAGALAELAYRRMETAFLNFAIGRERGLKVKIK